MSVAEELDKLKKLHDDGTITNEQYERARAKLLGEEHDERDDEERRPRRRRRDELDEEERDPRVPRKKVRDWCMLLHLSLFAGHTVPLGGIIAPIVIWQAKKDEMPELDQHGKNAVNWVISSLIYLAISIALCFVIIGIPLVIVLAVLNIVFPIIAAVKANEGREWKYPLAIPFFR
jgi:uncharacterized Tic20 family protein